MDSSFHFATEQRNTAPWAKAVLVATFGALAVIAGVAALSHSSPDSLSLNTVPEKGSLLSLDFDQCDRSCSKRKGSSWTGHRLSQHSCNCTQSSSKDWFVVPFDNDYDPPANPTTQCCGADHVNYPTQEAACANGTHPLHGGYCGECSNTHDITIYNATRNNMTNIAAKCAALYVLLGKQAASECFLKAAGLSKGCNECWVENFGCDAAQCMTICSIDRGLHLNNTKPDGSLNDCLECDEVYCGAPFIECAGANRRRSGIQSDIDRPQDQVWKRYAC